MFGSLSSLFCPGWIVPAVLSRLSCPGCPVPTILPRLSCPDYPAPAVFSCPGCPAKIVLSRLSCPRFSVLAVMFWQLLLSVLSGWLFRLAYRADLSWLSCPSYPAAVMPQLFWHDCAPQLFYFLCPVPQLSRPVIFRPPCRLILPTLSFPHYPLQLTCPDCPVPAVLSRLSCPGCPVPAVLYRLTCPGCPVPAK